MLGFAGLADHRAVCPPHPVTLLVAQQVDDWFSRIDHADRVRDVHLHERNVATDLILGHCSEAKVLLRPHLLLCEAGLHFLKFVIPPTRHRRRLWLCQWLALPEECDSMFLSCYILHTQSSDGVGPYTQTDTYTCTHTHTHTQTSVVFSPFSSRSPHPSQSHSNK